MPYNTFDTFSTPVVDDVQNRFSNFNIPDSVYDKPVYDAIPELKDLNISTLSETDVNVKAPVKKPNNDELFEASLRNMKPTDVSYYDASLETRFRNPELEFNPTKDMEDIYANNQGHLGRLARRFTNAWDNAVYTYKSSYLGQGRAMNELQELNWDAINNSSLNKKEQLDFTLKGEYNQIYNPVYLTKAYRDDPHSFMNTISLQGEGGSTLESVGFGVGAMAVGTQDAILGNAIKALSATGIGNVVLVAGALGTTALFNNDVRESIGEDNANLILGMVGGAVTSYGIGRGFDAIFKGGASTLRASQRLEEASRLLKDKQLRSALSTYIRGSADKLAAGTFLDKSDDILGTIKAANTAAKVGKGALTLGKMYISSGGEAGLEAIQAQVEYSKDRVKELGYEPTDEEFKNILNDSKEVGKEVYNLNRAILAVTNYHQMGDIITGTVTRNLAERSLKEGLISFGKEGYKSTLNVGKEALKRAWSNSYSEGIEEGLQYSVSLGTKNYIKEEQSKRNWISSQAEALAETVSSREGIISIISGMVAGMGQSEVGNVFRGVQTSINKQGFTAGYLGYDKKSIDSLVDQLNNNRTLLSGLLNDITINNTQDSVNEDGSINIASDYSKLRNHIEGRIARQGALAINTGTFDHMRNIVDDYFSTEDSPKKKESLIKIYGSEEEINKAKEGLLDKLDKYKVQHEAIRDYFYNPYTLNRIENANLTYNSLKLNTQKLINKVLKKDNTETEEKLDKVKESEKAIQDKKDIFDGLVNATAYNLFMYNQHNDRQKVLVDNLKTFFNGSNLFSSVMQEGSNINPLDFIVGGGEKSFELYYDKLNDEIEDLKQIENIDNIASELIPADMSSSKKMKELQAIKAKLDEYRSKELLDEKTDNEEVNEKHEHLNKKSNPLIQLLMGVVQDSTGHAVEQEDVDRVENFITNQASILTEEKFEQQKNLLKNISAGLTDEQATDLLNLMAGDKSQKETIRENIVKILNENKDKYNRQAVNQRKVSEAFSTDITENITENPDLILIKLRDLQSLHETTNTFFDDVNKLKSKTEQKEIIEYLYKIKTYQSNNIKERLVKEYIAPNVNVLDDEEEEEVNELEQELEIITNRIAELKGDNEDSESNNISAEEKLKTKLDNFEKNYRKNNPNATDAQVGEAVINTLSDDERQLLRDAYERDKANTKQNKTPTNEENQEVVTNAEYEAFIDKGIVSQALIEIIAEKIKKQEEPLTPRELEIVNDKTAEIIKALAQQPKQEEEDEDEEEESEDEEEYDEEEEEELEIINRIAEYLYKIETYQSNNISAKEEEIKELEKRQQEIITELSTLEEERIEDKTNDIKSVLNTKISTIEC